LADQKLRIGDWCVDAAEGTIARGDEVVRVETRTLRVLLCLADGHGAVVSSEELLEKAWTGIAVSQDSVYQAVASLRRMLGDDPKQPTYIVTVPRMGYRLVARVEPWREKEEMLPVQVQAAGSGNVPQRRRRPSRRQMLWAAAALIGLVVAGWMLLRSRSPAGTAAVSAAAVTQPARSIAVVPFLDLTEGMKEGEFADGMTEELIGRLSKVPGLRVPGPTASFYYRDKQVSPAEMGRALGVSYLLDGSVRKAGKRLRVSARLLRADTSYVVWTESYDRPLDDILMVQDEIAGEVTKALRSNLDGANPVR
jgi:transcriptional activator of cad operon